MIIGSGTWPAGQRVPDLRQSYYCRQIAAGAPGGQEQVRDYIDSLVMTTEHRRQCGYLMETNGNAATAASRPLYQSLVSVRVPSDSAGLCSVVARIVMVSQPVTPGIICSSTLATRRVASHRSARAAWTRPARH